MKNKIIDVPFVVTQEFVEDVMTTVMCGGSNYWIDTWTILPLNRDDLEIENLTCGQALASGRSIVILDNEEYNNHLICLEDFINGYKKYATNAVKSGLEYCTDASDIDAEIADMIFQYTVFGAIIYG